jgi:glycosyltransferase involved in cell wall biosynthesis
VTEEPPDFVDKGGSIRQAHLFRPLAERFPTDLLLTRELHDPAILAAARTVHRLPAPRAPWPERNLARRALTLAIAAGSRLPTDAYAVLGDRLALRGALRWRAADYDLICVEHESLAPVLTRRGGTRWIITFHHVLSQMIDHEIAQTPGGRQRRLRELDRFKARRLEGWAVRTYDRAIACSADDAAVLGDLVPAAPHPAVVPNGVDLTAFRPAPLGGDPVVLFPGSLDYAPNVDGARWLCGEVWPQVRAAVPDARLVIAGRRPVAEIRRLDGREGIVVRPDVPSMAAEFNAARVVAVPLRVGTGTRLKALEAMASGRPVVGTTIGLAGIGVRDGRTARVADSPAEFAAAVVALLHDGGEAERLARAARDHVEAGFGWETIGRDFTDLVADVVSAPQAPASAAR